MRKMPTTIGILLIFALTFALGACSKNNGPSAAEQQKLDELQARLARLQTGVTTAKDVSEIKKLQRAYGYYLDRGLADDMADLFTQDHPTAEYGNGGVFTSQDSIRKAFYALSPDNRLADGKMTTHMQLQGVVNVGDDGKTAKARWRAFAMTAHDGQAFWQEGPYEMEYIKEEGVWKIKKLRWYQTFTAPYEGGWAKKRPTVVRSATGSNAPKADLPPSEPDDKSWPDVSVTRFHYDNPVTGRKAATQAVAQVTPPAASLSTVPALVHQVQLLRDEKDIERLQRAYGYYIDKKMWDQATDLYADNGTLELGLGGVYVGKASIRRNFDQIGPQGLKDGELANHMQLQPIVHVADDGLTAKGRWRGLNQAGVYGQRAIWGEGIYENEYVKENGIWKIQALHYYTSFTTPYEKGWAKEVLPVVRPIKKGFEPDRPPSVVYEPFPKYFVPPFHFSHPVKGRSVQSSASSTSGAPAEAPSVADIEKLIGDAERQIARIKDQNAIENLVGAYGYYLDKLQWDQFADLFAEDGSIELGQRGVYVGKKRVRESLELFGPQGPRHGWLNNHIQLQPIIDVAEDGLSAKIRSRALIQLGQYGGQGNWGEGVYENEVVKEDGVWKFKVVHFFNTFATDYDKGWAKSAIGIPAVSDKLPPDKPPTIKFQQYPTAFVPPFHYNHPVTGK